MHTHPEQLAWRILLTAFLIFVLLCSTAVYIAQWFVFQSTVPMHVELHAARGTAGVSAQNVQEAAYVADYRLLNTLPLTIQTGDNSQVSITFSDPRTQTPIASVVLFRNSRISIIAASSPRFGLNQKPYRIELVDVSGRAEILIIENSGRSADLQVRSPFTTAHLSEPGRYFINTSADFTEFSTLFGEATILTSSGASLPISANQQTIISRESTELSVTSNDISLLENPFFHEDLNFGWVTINRPLLGEPEGFIYNARYAGRPVVVIDRAQINFPDRQLSHGSDGILQKISLDVSKYTSLSINATFYVEEQSLSRCGEDGSECPIMIHLKFIDEFGTTQDFIQGFYAYDNPTIPWPERCSSCRFLHERINLGSWFTYESLNLIAEFSEARPMTLKEIFVYASGHAYKVYISEINLIASIADEAEEELPTPVPSSP